MLSREDVLQQALALPPSDQAYVADMLESQIAGQPSISPESAELWSNEIDRRVAAYERGELASIEFEQSLQQLRVAISQHRQERDRT
ncbi:MAG: addiction module protein [Pirellulales bacterium]